MTKQSIRDRGTESPRRCREVLLVCGGLVFIAAAAPAVAEIPWRTGHTTTRALSTDEIRTSIGELAARPGARHIVVQFAQPLEEPQKTALARAGLNLLGYLGENAFFASTDPGVDPQAVARTRTVIDVRPIARAWKLHPAIIANDYPRYAVDDTNVENPRVAAYVQFHRDVDLATTGVKTARRHGAAIMDRMRSVNSLVIELPLAAIGALADEDVVQWIEPPLPRLSEVNADVRVLTQVNTLQASPYDLDGTGVRVMVYDGAFAQASHPDFGGRLTVRDNSGLHDHPTHVAGTIGGDGSIGGGTDRGMAPAVTIESYGLETNGTGIFLYTNPGDLESDYDEAINTYGTVITNNSISANVEINGFPCLIQGDYGITSALIDSIVDGSLGAPYRIVWANGNERQGNRCDIEGLGDYYSMSPPAGAKNAIAVGALFSNSEAMTSFSSWGPVDDGRMKPDICAPGCQSSGDLGVTSTSAGGGYLTFCGTSMAAPTVTGLCALILEDYRVQFPAQGDPRNATLKALLAHNAKDKGNPGPDYQFGYGMVKGQATIDFMRSGNFDEDQVSQGGVVAYEAIVTAGDTELKVTLAWDDVAGTPNVIPSLVNDLDLVVISPSSVQAFPWRLNAFNPSARATQTQGNHVDIIEQVVVEAPEAGRWTIEVHGFNVPQGPQSFSICVSPGILSPGITISLPDDVPEAIVPGVSTPVTVEIVAVGESVVGGTETLHHRYDGGSFQSSPLTSLGGGFYEGTLSPPNCSATPEFYFSAKGTLSGAVRLPANAPSDVFSSLVGAITVILDDDLETDQGWMVGAGSDTATGGIWTRIDPNGTEAQPEDDHTASPGVKCFVTGQGSVGGTLEENDVDGGATTLFTPTMDLSAFDDATISYYRWFSNGTGAERDGTGAEPNTEVFTVDISDDGGSNWTTVEVVGPTGPDVVGGWIFHEFNVATFVTPTDEVVMRFVAADTGDFSVVEAAIDDLLVTALTVADTDGDGVCDADDLCPGGDDTVDTNENGIPDECDAHTPLPAASPHDRKKNRYLSFDPNNTDIAVALKVTMTASFNHPDALGTTMWVGAPDVDGLAIVSTTPVIRLWPEAAIHVSGCLVSPVATYDVRAMIAEGALPTDPMSIDTIDQPGDGKFWGDTVGMFTGTEWTPPQGIVNFDDVTAVNKTYQAAPGAPHVSVSDVEPQFINRVANFNDVLFVIFAFQGNPYPFGCPADPCQDNLVNPCP